MLSVVKKQMQQRRLQRQRQQELSSLPQPTKGPPPSAQTSASAASLSLIAPVPSSSSSTPALPAARVRKASKRSRAAAAPTPRVQTIFERARAAQQPADCLQDNLRYLHRQTKHKTAIRSLHQKLSKTLERRDEPGRKKRVQAVAIEPEDELRDDYDDMNGSDADERS